MTENPFFKFIPSDAKRLYIHVSHRFGGHDLLRRIKENYDEDDILITSGPKDSGQSFTSFNEEIEVKKKEALERQAAKFSEDGLDVVLYLCNNVCDGYQHPVFPQNVETKLHFWHAMSVAEGLQKPLIIGYEDNFCFSVPCYEREQITDRKIKCPTRIVRM